MADGFTVELNLDRHIANHDDTVTLTAVVSPRPSAPRGRASAAPFFPFVAYWRCPPEAGEFEASDATFTALVGDFPETGQRAVTIQRTLGQDLTITLSVPSVIPKAATPDITVDLYRLRTAPQNPDDFLRILGELAAGPEDLEGLDEPLEPVGTDTKPLTLNAGAPTGTGGAPPVPMVVELTRARVAPTDDQSLWSAIRVSTQALSFESYTQFIDDVFCPPGAPVSPREAVNKLAHGRSLPFPDVDPYRLLKVATEVFMRLNCGVFFQDEKFRAELLELDPALGEEALRMGRSLASGEISAAFARYAKRGVLPYLALVKQNLSDWRVTPRPSSDDPDLLRVCNVILREKLTNPCMIELIWSYWHEEGMLVQTMKAITMRFQNRQAGNGVSDPLALIEIDPLRPLNNFLWGYVQDEDHRLTVARRAYEYDHHYGLTLLGKAVPRVRGADSRSRFIEAYHNLLHLCAIFFKEDDDTTVVADGFPILNALREVHLLLTQGAHNQYLDLPWTARQEMLMEEWLLGRPEFREFLPRRIMVDYPEQWMHSVEAMKGLQGWNNSDVLHFRDLGITGERLLLSIRFGAWTTAQFAESAANWARYFRSEIQRYTHAYRAVTGIDLTEHPDSTMPALLLRQRLPRRGGVQITPVARNSAGSLPAWAAPRGLSQPIGQPASRELGEWSQHELP